MFPAPLTGAALLAALLHPRANQDPTPPTVDPTISAGQEQPPGDPDDEDVRLEDLVVTATGTPQDQLTVPAATSVLRLEQRLRRLPQTVPDALIEEVGVVIQKTNLGGGSPIIRGRSGKEVLQLIDGQRFNNAISRRNHQYLNTLGLGAVDRIEVVRGPASVLYGSDALGGAINVITVRNDPWEGPDAGAHLFTQYQTADRGITVDLDASVQAGAFGLAGGVGYFDFDDLRAGDHHDPIGAVDSSGRQRPTGYDGGSAWAALTHRITENDRLDFFYFQSHQYDVPRSDVIIANDKEPNPPDLRRDSDPQVLHWYELSFAHDSPGEVLEGFTITTTVNQSDETRRRVRVSDPSGQRNEYDRSFVPGAKAQFRLRPHQDHLVITGAEGYYESVDSHRHDIDLTTGALEHAESRFPDNSVYQSYGVYLQDEWEIADDLRWTNGVRYSQVRVRLDLQGLTVGPVGPFGKLDETYQDFTFATGLSYEVRPSTWVYGSVSRGFRAPNIDDLAVLGDFSSGERVPNLDVDPETVLNFELGAKHHGPRRRAGASAAIAFYQDLLDPDFAFTLDGVDYFQIDNRSRAHIFSFETWAEEVLCESAGGRREHVLFGNAFASYGRDSSEDDAVSKVPPPQGELGYRIAETSDAWFGECFVRGALRQTRLSAADEADPRFPEDGTPGWVTCNLRGGYALNDDIHAFVALENLFDYRYRVHGSGIDASGTNLVLQLDWRF